MQNRKPSFVDKLIPYLFVGMVLATLVGLAVIFSVLLLWGLVIGFVLYVVMWIKNKLFPRKQAKSKKGRIIEHKDL